MKEGFGIDLSCLVAGKLDMVVLCSGLRPAVMVDYAGPVLPLVKQLPELLSLLSFVSISASTSGLVVWRWLQL